MICKLTGKEGKGIRAHIIPKSFYSIDPGEKQVSRVYTNADGNRSQKVPIGIYDTTIVTVEGERIFSEWDDYASELLIKNKECFEILERNGEAVGFQIMEYDYRRLKLFFLSVLWRASVSSQKFFSRVNLGPYEEIVRNALLLGDPGDSEWLSVVLARWSDHPGGSGMLDPHSARFDGLKYYVIYLGSYIVYIKVDKRMTGKMMRRFQILPDSPLIVLGRKITGSKELLLMSNMARAHANKSR